MADAIARLETIIVNSLRNDEHWLTLAGVVLVHAGLLAAVLIAADQDEPPVMPPVMTGVLVAPPAQVQPPKPLPVAPQPKKPRPVVRPAPAPLPKAPPSKRAIALPEAKPEPEPVQAEEAAVAAPSVAPPAPSPSPAPAPAPVIPPRSDASHLSNPAPDYPMMSRRLSEQGRVLFDVYILPDGSVGEIKLKRSSGYARLDAAAQDAIRRWRYVPARRGNEAIPYWYVQPINFSLGN